VTQRLWIDVEDLFEYARGNPRPSGIQRLAFEIYRALHERPDAAEVVRFVRHQPVRNTFRLVPWQQIEDLFAGLVMSEAEPSLSPVLQKNGRYEEPRDKGPIRPDPATRQFARKVVHRLPPVLRSHVIHAIITQAAALRALAGLIGFMAHGTWKSVARALGSARTPARPPSGAGLPDADMTQGSYSEETDDTFTRLSAPGDILLVLGSPWSHPDYASLIAAQRKRGLKFALLIYDLIPLRRPEWCDRNLVRLFRSWFDSVFPLCDYAFAISRATAADVESYARSRGIRLSGPITPVPIGTAFSNPGGSVKASRCRPLPQPGTYALIVSTIEARKNHLLLFRIWRKLLEDLPLERVPTLVFAGRIGWLVDDLMRQIANTDNLCGKLVIIENPTDTELTQLYKGCRFTLFPSFFEGWGLPVTESLAFGKPCLTSNSTSLPEAGGNLTRRFDPDSLAEAYAAVRAVIDDPDGLARWEAQVRREFEPVLWSTTADAILTGLGYPAVTAPRVEIERRSKVVSLAR
jgi:glycosyltransferase involved in cell wall biosynthesis